MRPPTQRQVEKALEVALALALLAAALVFLFDPWGRL